MIYDESPSQFVTNGTDVYSERFALVAVCAHPHTPTATALRLY